MGVDRRHLLLVWMVVVGVSLLVVNVSIPGKAARDAQMYWIDSNNNKQPIKDCTANGMCHAVRPKAAGAHYAHLTRGITCRVCHDGMTHGDLIVTVSLTNADGFDPSGITVYESTGKCSGTCHGKDHNSPYGLGWGTGAFNTSPSGSWYQSSDDPDNWDFGTQGYVPCTNCHGLPPATGKHIYHVMNKGYGCDRCHYGSTDPRHNNGQVEVLTSLNYNPSTNTCMVPGCHGKKSWGTPGPQPTPYGCQVCHDASATTVSSANQTDTTHYFSISGDSPGEVDFSAFNVSIHKNLNTSNPSDSYWDCIECHTNATNHMERSFVATNANTNYCYECHNGSYSGAPVVTEHFKSGEDLKAAISAATDSESCILCHNLDEMKNAYSIPASAENSFANPSHYGKPRNDIVLNVYGTPTTDCYYCHQNTTTAFVNVMQNTNHTNMYDHSDSSNSPKCWSCHELGRIHDQGHKIPQYSNLNQYCMQCHSTGAGNTRAIADLHNSTLGCYTCHMDKSDTRYDTVTAQIHGIKYINSDGTYTRWDKTNAANCVDCHMNANTSSSLSAWGYTIPTIPKLNHSNDMSGQKWGNYWTTNIEACNYCHQSEIHKSSTELLGNVTLIADGNKDLTGTWCANCHYTQASGYNGTALTPAPPRIDVNEGTANDGTSWVDHTSFLTSGYTDSVCKQCHGSLAQSATQLKDFVHAVSEGTGGACITCHETYTGSIGINKSSYGRHANVNTTDGAGNLTDSDCKTCHYDTSNMFNPGWSVKTYRCDSCHINGNPVTVPSDVQITTFQHGNNNCKSCHIAGGFNSSKYYHWNYSTPYGAVKEPGWPGWTGTVVKCQDCHYSHSKRDEPFFAPGIGTYMATKYTNCGGGNCHGGGTIHNSELAPYMYPPTVSISVSNPYALIGDVVRAVAEVTGYAVQIYNASYKIVFNGSTVAEGPLTPDDGEFGGVNSKGYGYEKFTINIDTTGFEPGEYRLYVTGEKDTGKKSTKYTTFTLAKGGIEPSPTTYNFGFESWTQSNTPVNWAPNSLSVSPGTPRSGNYSASLSTSSSGYLESAKFDITAGASYRVTVYISKPSGGGYAGISVVQWNGNSIISETPMVKLQGYTSDWVLLGLDITAEKTATHFSIRLHVSNTTASFDDVSVKIKPFVKTNYVTNGGFESNWGTGKPDKYFKSYEYRQTPLELIKAWEPKNVASNGMDINTTVAVGTRSAGLIGSGYWTTPYADPAYGTLYSHYQSYYGINLAEGTEFTVEFMIYSDKMNGSAGIELVYRKANDFGDNAGTPETYKVLISQTTDWIGIVTSGKMPAGKTYLQLKLFSQGTNHVLFDEVAVY